jgi:hypothetical protein
MKKLLKFYETDKHHYIRTTLSYLRKLRISKLISQFSKLDGNIVYLEGHDDGRLFEQRHIGLLTEINYVVETSLKQEFFDNLPPYSDCNCHDRQYAGFSTKWIVNQAITIFKPDNIINNNNFLTLESGDVIEFVPSVYINGRRATKLQLGKIKLSIESVSTNIVLLDDCVDFD